MYVNTDQPTDFCSSILLMRNDEASREMLEKQGVKIITDEGYATPIQGY